MAFFTGDLDNHWFHTSFNNYLIFTNGVNPIYKHDGISAFIEELGGANNLNYKCRYLARMAERVCLYHTIESGTQYPRRVRWPIAGNAEAFTGTGSGSVDLDSVMGDDQITGALEIAGAVVIYGERTLVLQEYTGNVTNPFRFSLRVSRKGLPAPMALVDIGGEHFYLGWDDFYAYIGGRSSGRQGLSIIKTFLRGLSYSQVKRSFIVFTEESSEVIVHYPSTNATTPDKYISLNLDNKAWSRGTRSYTGWGFFRENTDESWDADDEPWDSDLTRWDDSVETNLSPFILYGTLAGQVHKYDQSTNNLNGSAITSYIDTKDFAIADGSGNIRLNTNWAALRLTLKGDAASILYSTDQGVTYTELADSPLTLNDNWTIHELNFEITSTYIRFRMKDETVNSTFDLKQVAAGYYELSDIG